MDEDGEGPIIKYRKINYSFFISCHCCLQLCQVSVLALRPLVRPSWLSCCLWSSAASAFCYATNSCPVAPPPVHLLLCHRLLLCPSSSLVRLPLVRPGCLLCHLLSCRRLPATCASISHCTTTSHCAPLMPFFWLVAVSPLITPDLPSVSASNSCCTIASCCAPLVPLVHSGWLSCSLSS
jgi:hypothetical protein